MLFALPVASMAQGSGRDEKQMIKIADQEWQKGNFKQSFNVYKQVVAANPKSSYANFRVGEIYFLTDSAKIKSVPYLKASIQYAPISGIDTDYTAYYYLGYCYMLEEKYDTAIQCFQKYQSRLEPTADNKEAIAEINRQIQICNMAPGILKRNSDSASYLIDGQIAPLYVYNMGDSINSKYPEYSQVLFNNNSTMIFTSRRPEKHNDVDDRTGKYYENMYISYKKTNGTWTDPILYNQEVHLRTKELYTATVDISADQSVLFSYRDGSILESKKVHGSWSEPEKISKLIPKLAGAYVPSIFLSNDGKILLVVTDMPGGVGGRDIYMCTLDKSGNWSEPQNLGPNINTDQDEDAPFLLPDNKTLFFSSKGRGGLGGYDIFVSHYEHGNWSTPQNLGAPINSPGDDIYFTYNDSINNGKGYFSSSRLGGFGDMDVYGYSIVKNPVDTTKPISLAQSDTVDVESRIGKFPTCIVYFQLAKAILQPKYYPGLDSVVAYLKANKTMKIFVNGYTCAIGDVPYNQDLSVMRASVVANYFYKHGIEFERVIYRGYGKTHYVAPNDGIHNYLNRRSEVYRIIK